MRVSKKLTAEVILNKIRIGLVDDHKILRQSLKRTIEMETDMIVAGSWSSGEEALKESRENLCDLYIIDLKLPGINGIETSKQLKKLDPTVKIIVLTAYSDDSDIFSSIEAGILGYLPKETEIDDLMQAIRSVHMGHAFLDPQITKGVLDRFTHLEQCIKNNKLLSPLECKILTLAAEGNSNTVISEITKVKEGTVKFHLREIFKKLGAKDRAHAVALGFKLGEIT